MKGLVVSSALVLVTAGGCTSAPGPIESSASTSSAIQGGVADTAHDFAVGIFIDFGGGEGAICSGALLAPNLVATARHCAAQISSDIVDCTSSKFGAQFSPSQYTVRNGVSLGTGPKYGVAQIVTPSGADQTGFCGNDIALLILSENVQLAQYVEPVLTPPMTDHGTWATTVAAIGYGIDSPADEAGTSAGERRIRENIDLVCIPNDPTFVDCYSNPDAKQFIFPSEFESGDGTCEGDSGSGAFDQTQFDNGKWVSFGVLSRGGISTDGETCQGSTYTRFDSWAGLIVSTALQAASMGGYTAPTWATSAAIDASSPEDDGSGAADSGVNKPNGAGCVADDQCVSGNCVAPQGKSFVCAAACGVGGSCTGGDTCISNFCFADAAPAAHKGGCSVGDEPVGRRDPSHPVPWRGAAVALGVVGLAWSRRRRRR